MQRRRQTVVEGWKGGRVEERRRWKARLTPRHIDITKRVPGWSQRRAARHPQRDGHSPLAPFAILASGRPHASTARLCPAL